MKWLVLMTAVCLATTVIAQPEIETVSTDENRALRVNDERFFPIMIWLQNPENFPRAIDAGINTIAGYWPGSGDTEDVVEYLGLVEEAGLLGVMPWHEGLIGHPRLLGFIHDDEPDLSHTVSDATVTAAEHMRLNSSTPLSRIVDGVTHSWSVLDPMEGAEITVELAEPATIERIGVWLTISEGLAVAREVGFVGDGEEIARAELVAKKGRQEIGLEEPVTLQTLTMRVESAYPGENVWGSVGEVEGFNAAGENMLLSPPREVPRQQPEETLSIYNAIKQAGAQRPVFMTLTARFADFSERWTDEQKQNLYPGYVQAADVVGFDVYPIYGWARPDWIDRVHDATQQLVKLAGDRPVYAWIETSKGSQWVSEERQMDVTPEHIRNEVWQAITAGATAIGYFTHIWKPAYSQFGVPDENVAMMRQVNGQITRLTPALLAPECTRKVGISLEGDLRADVLARQAEGGLYLFAVNYDPSATDGEATISVEGLAAGTQIEVVDETRTLTADDGAFTDHFDALAVHIYRIEEQ
ncbi:MAG: hypothetical protein GF393_03940 [Armatimonadia bacterium]|nr:hypothetical protein [Armatimonadia bacterium]